MSSPHGAIRPWLAAWFESRDVPLWGFADLEGISTPVDASGRGFPLAIAWAIPMDAETMAGVREGPNQAYADEYERVNLCIDALSLDLASEIMDRGFGAKSLAASARTDPTGIQGESPHKTAATRAGLGWIGRHRQPGTRRYGSWVRLGTVFTDLLVLAGVPFVKAFCGQCNRCVEACPAKALKGISWYPGVSREQILDAEACDRWKKESYPEYHRGHNCGICCAVCPCGLKLLKKGRP